MHTQPRRLRRFRSLAILALACAVFTVHPRAVQADRSHVATTSFAQDIWQDMTPADLPPPVVTPTSPPPKPAVCDDEKARTLCLANATVIVEVGQGIGFERRALIIAVATAMQESDLHNLGTKAFPKTLEDPRAEGSDEDHDSVGLFQQRPSQGWGSTDQLLDRRYAAGKFFARLGELTDATYRATHELWQTAYRVQVCAKRYAFEYQKHEPMATAVVDYVVYQLSTVATGGKPSRNTNLYLCR